jgi:dipeptidyl aminopeptidase/acylaminoacyl peptidase
VQVTRIAADRLNEAAPAFTPDGRSVAYVRTGGGLTELLVQSIDALTPIVLVRSEAPVSGPRWSPDGNVRVAAGDAPIAGRARRRHDLTTDRDGDLPVDPHVLHHPLEDAVRDDPGFEDIEHLSLAQDLSGRVGDDELVRPEMRLRLRVAPKHGDPFRLIRIAMACAESPAPGAWKPVLAQEMAAIASPMATKRQRSGCGR